MEIHLKRRDLEVPPLELGGYAPGLCAAGVEAKLYRLSEGQRLQLPVTIVLSQTQTKFRHTWEDWEIEQPGEQLYEMVVTPRDGSSSSRQVTVKIS